MCFEHVHCLPGKMRKTDEINQLTPSRKGNNLDCRFIGVRTSYMGLCNTCHFCTVSLAMIFNCLKSKVYKSF